MKKQTLSLSVLLAIGTVLSIGCMDREPAPVCPVPTELKSSAPAAGGFEGVDILVVVDNSGSMAEEQQILATAFFPLVNSLINPLPTWTLPSADDVRVAITTSDMGVQYDGNKYTGSFSIDPDCLNNEGKGDNGKFVTEYTGAAEVSIVENTIPCGEDASQCPTGWTCGDINSDTGVGKCVSGGGNSLVNCPPSPSESNASFVSASDGDLALRTACLANTGTEGCNFEQQLAAGAAGLRYDSDFIRERSLTTVLIVSDEEDCSIKSNEWHELGEFTATNVNMVCGLHEDLLFEIKEIKDKYDSAKADKSDNASGMLFAAIIGVPPVTACQGPGSGLGGCLDVELEVGTMGKPGTVERLDSQNNMAQYYEYACTREDGSGNSVTKAYPGKRYVELAQLYGDMSYIYSICEEDWSEAMTDIAALIAANLGGACYDKRLNWDPKEETAGCNVVYTYKWNKDDYSSAPKCPEEYDWSKDSPSEVRVEKIKIGGKNEEFWVRDCTVPKLTAPLNCADLGDKAKVYENERFGWYYCENPGENTTGACTDRKDNDRDGKEDCLDEDCFDCQICGGPGCEPGCPYMVTLSDDAIDAINDSQEQNIVCLQQYRFADPNCKESTPDSCTDGLDNDGNGPYDCNSYDKGVTINSDHYPEQDARRADPDCCPMIRDSDGKCQFLNVRGEPELDSSGWAWAGNCGVSVGADNVPDSCCEAAVALFCQLPTDYATECDSRSSSN